MKVIQNKESLRNCHNHEEPKETGQLNVKWYPGWSPRIETGYQIKTKKIWTKYGFQLLVMSQYWFIKCTKCTTPM